MKDYKRAFLGFFIISFGVSMMVHVHEVGLEPWAAALVGLTEVGLTYGTWNMIIHAVFISLTFLLERRPPRVGTFLNMVVIGPLIDLFLFLSLLPDVNSIGLQYLFFLFGVLVSSFGMSLLITSNVGAGSKTQFYVVLHEKTSWKLSHCKNIVEVAGLLLALLVGGPLFLGTILFILVSSPSIEFFVGRLKRYPA